MRNILFFSSFLFCFYTQAIFGQLSAEQIINKSIEISGFTKTSVKSFEIMGLMYAYEDTFQLDIHGILPNSFNISMKSKSIKMVKGNNEDFSWAYISLKDSITKYPQEKNMSEAFYIHWTGGLDKMTQNTTEIKNLGSSSLDKTAVYLLEITKNKNKYIYFIDKISFLVLKIYDVKTDEEFYYIDYHKNGNLILPYRIEGYKKGKLEMTFVFKNMEINHPIDNQVFYPDNN